MRRGTTPTIGFKLNDIDVENLTSVYMTIKQDTHALTKTGADITLDTEENTVSTKLTQAETLAFEVGGCKIQMRAISSDGNALASDTIYSHFDDILLDGEIS